jgi:hypothetical protein
MIDSRSMVAAIFAAMIFSILLLALSGCALKFPVGNYGSVTIGYEPNDAAFDRYGIDLAPVLRDK